MNQRHGVKFGISTILLIVVSTSFYFYFTNGDEALSSLTCIRSYIIQTAANYKVPLAGTPSDSNDARSGPGRDGKLPTSRDNRSSPSTFTERFSNYKSPAPATPSDDSVPSSITFHDNSPSAPSFANGDISKSLHETSQEPTVKEKNNTSRVSTPDKLPQSIIDHVKTFVFFLGHARSGHSIVGSLMDGHPHMVISHEYDVFGKLSGRSLAPNKTAIFNALWRNSKETLVKGLRAKSKSYKGYTLFVDGLYQGKYVDHIDVIGDKKGGVTARSLALYPKEWLNSFNILKSLNLPIKVVYVIRNPYDNIATSLLYATNPNHSVGKLKQSNKSIAENDTLVTGHTKYYFLLHKAIVDAMTTYNLDVIEIHNKDLVSDPKGTLLKLCHHVGVICSDNYLEICKNKIFSSESRTRLMIKWTDEQLQTIQQNIDQYSNLKGYNFDSM